MMRAPAAPLLARNTKATESAKRRMKNLTTTVPPSSHCIKLKPPGSTTLLATFLITCSAGFVFADSLSDLVNEALANNQGLRAAEKQWESAKQQIRAEGGFADPMVGVTAERDNTRFSDYMDMSYMVSQQLPAWGERSSRVNAAKLQAEAAGFRFLETGRALRADTTETAWALWLADRRIETMQEMAQLAFDLTESVRARYESGQAMSADLVRAQIEQIKLTNEISNLLQIRAVALTTLNAQLNAAPDTPRSLDALDRFTEATPSLAELLAKAQEVNCGLLAMERDAKAQELLTRAARANRRPMVELFVEGRQLEGRSGINEIDTGVALNLPWIWNAKHKGAIASADAERQVAEAAFQNEVRQIEQRVSEQRAQAENALRTTSVLRDNIVPLARQAVEQTQAAYTAGTGSLLDRIEAQRTLLDAELDLHTAVADHARALARLHQLVGTFGEWEESTGALPRTK